MHLRLKIWRQPRGHAGKMVAYELDGVEEDMSFLDMLDLLNETLILRGELPVEFDHDCREGICGQCGLVINGRPHGAGAHLTTCQLHMRQFKDGDQIVVEPFRVRAFPVLCDLKVDRGALDRIVEAGGYISCDTAGVPEANAIPVHHDVAESAFDSAACIGCGACVAACKNASAALFTGAKVSHLAKLPQGRVEASERVRRMVEQMDKEGFGSCTHIGACEAECPQNIGLDNIARMNWEYIKALFR